VYIAVAFFTDDRIIDDLSRKQCPVKLIVRLGKPTSPAKLENVLKMEMVQVRYVTARSFHPKLFIFGDRAALVGSANLTDAGMVTNQEIMLSVESDDPRFSSLKELFHLYWEQAEVLDKRIVARYGEILKKYNAADIAGGNIEKEVIDLIGDVTINNIDWGKNKKSKKLLYIDDFRRSYQEFQSAYKTVKRLYLKDGRRKRGGIPVHIEIDSFVSYVRDEHAQGEKWKYTPLLVGVEQEQVINNLIDQWHGVSWEYFENTIAEEKYPKIKKVFSSEDAIKNATDDDVMSGLKVLHSFHDRQRFFPGGLQTLVDTFLEKNDSNKIRSSLAYLLYGDGDIIIRMANLLYNSDYSLKQFGRANIQELVGWMIGDDFPIVNGRTTKVLRFMGFDIIQL